VAPLVDDEAVAVLDQELVERVQYCAGISVHLALSTEACCSSAHWKDR
jgi:hypothetical protein